VPSALPYASLRGMPSLVVVALLGCSGPGSSGASDSGAVTLPSCPGATDLTVLEVPDAALGDAGLNLPGCYGCVKASCATQLSTCNTACDCRQGVAAATACMADGGYKLGECLAVLDDEGDGGIDQTAVEVSNCLEQSCMPKCNYTP
jgi:hypothetical protein